MSNLITILAIESSCDDTSASVIQDGNVLSNHVANQDVHKDYGGVVPELASRMHDKHIVPVVDKAIKAAGIQISDLDAIAFTRGPGLLGSLLVGVNFAKSMALGLNIPLVEVNHMEAHVMAHFAEAPYPEFPFLCLTVSGGHTQLVLVDGYNQMSVLGSTIDDAAGEAFDKTGKIIGLPYPAGPVIDQYAQKGTPRFDFTKPSVGEFDFSFSGLKTSILYFLQDQVKEDPAWVDDNLHDICASVQHTIVTILLEKLEYTAQKLGISRVAIAGGVSANSELRTRLQALADTHGWKAFIPSFDYCTDNAAMIGVSGYYRYLDGTFSDQSIAAAPRLSMTT